MIDVCTEPHAACARLATDAQMEQRFIARDRRHIHGITVRPNSILRDKILWSEALWACLDKEGMLFSVGAVLPLELLNR